MMLNETPSEDSGVRELLRLLVPKEMADDIEAVGACEDDLEFVAEQITLYLEADPETREYILANHKDGIVTRIMGAFRQKTDPQSGEEPDE